MKFSHPVCRTSKGMAIASLHHVFACAVSETEVVIEASSDTVYFTLRLFCSAPNLIGVKFEGFWGRPKCEPTFESLPMLRQA